MPENEYDVARLNRGESHGKYWRDRWSQNKKNSNNVEADRVKVKKKYKVEKITNEKFRDTIIGTDIFDNAAGRRNNTYMCVNILFNVSRLVL